MKLNRNMYCHALGLPNSSDVVEAAAFPSVWKLFRNDANLIQVTLMGSRGGRVVYERMPPRTPSQKLNDILIAARPNMDRLDALARGRRELRVLHTALLDVLDEERAVDDDEDDDGF